ncbi:hypothetical protein ACFL3V_01295 [Nanoarchaeota archaeon]
MMSFTEDEKKLLKLLVQKELESVDSEGKTVLIEDNPGFLALEERYTGFLENLLKKL